MNASLLTIEGKYSKTCLIFMFLFTFRTKGNQNNFVSKESCEARCKSKSQPLYILTKYKCLAECTNPCASGDLLLTPVSGKPRQCGPTSPCPTGITNLTNVNQV